MIISSRRMLRTGNIIFGILTIGMLGLITDYFFKWFLQQIIPLDGIDGRAGQTPYPQRLEDIPHQQSWRFLAIDEIDLKIKNKELPPSSVPRVAKVDPSRIRGRTGETNPRVVRLDGHVIGGPARTGHGLSKAIPSFPGSLSRRISGSALRSRACRRQRQEQMAQEFIDKVGPEGF